MTDTDRRPAATIADLRAEFDEQSAAVGTLFDAIDGALLTRRPPSGRWSVVEHVDHLVKVNEAYADAIGAAVERSRARGRSGSGPFRGSWLGRGFVRSLEPPPKMRVRTMAAMQPDADLSIQGTLSDFGAVQQRLGDILRGAEGLDLDRIRAASPFARILRAPVFSWFSVVSAHNRRHLWLIEETLDELAPDRA